jgi:hypothetical protein
VVPCVDGAEEERLKASLCKEANILCGADATVYELDPTSGRPFANVMRMRSAKIRDFVRVGEWAPNFEQVLYDDLLEMGADGVQDWLDQLARKHNIPRRPRQAAANTWDHLLQGLGKRLAKTFYYQGHCDSGGDSGGDSSSSSSSSDSPCGQQRATSGLCDFEACLSASELSTINSGLDPEAERLVGVRLVQSPPRVVQNCTCRSTRYFKGVKIPNADAHSAWQVDPKESLVRQSSSSSSEGGRSAAAAATKSHSGFDPCEKLQQIRSSSLGQAEGTWTRLRPAHERLWARLGCDGGGRSGGAH